MTAYSEVYLIHVMRKLFSLYANNKCIDQPSLPSDLVSTFVTCYLESTIGIYVHISSKFVAEQIPLYKKIASLHCTSLYMLPCGGYLNKDITSLHSRDSDQHFYGGQA